MLNIIELKNVTAYRGTTRVFHHFSLAIGQGCHTVILGPNGAGKTTFLKLLTRDIYPVQRDDSDIRIFGQERWNVLELRTRFGLVSYDLQQEYVGHARGLNVILSGYYASTDTWGHQQFSPADIARATHLMEWLGVAHLRERPFATMSTGEQRRFLLGRALVHDPEVLILDEPTSGLDVKACFQYLDLVRSLMRAGTTVILVTHHIHEIPPEVSRVVLMNGGEILSDGPKAEVLTSAHLSQLFDTPLEVVRANGFYQVVPSTRK